MNSDGLDFLPAATSLPRRHLGMIAGVLGRSIDDPARASLGRTLDRDLQWVSPLADGWQARNSLLETAASMSTLRPDELVTLGKAATFFKGLTSHDLAVAALDTSRAFFDLVKTTQEPDHALAMVDASAMLSLSQRPHGTYIELLESYLSKTRKKLKKLQPGSFPLFEEKLKNRYGFTGDWLHLQQRRDLMLKDIEDCEEMLLEIQVCSMFSDALQNERAQE